MKKIAIGIIGCGKIAQMRHIPEYAANANAKLCGFFDVNLQRAQELADQYGTKAYGSYQELLADPQIEAVSVLTPNFTHAEITIAALKADAAKAQEYCRKSIEAQISAALDAGKITADQKAAMQSYGEKMGADALKELLSGMQVRETLREQIMQGSKTTAKKFDDYTREELLRMREEDPARFTELLDAKYSE